MKIVSKKVIETKYMNDVYMLECQNNSKYFTTSSVFKNDNKENASKNKYIYDLFKDTYTLESLLICHD